MSASPCRTAPPGDWGREAMGASARGASPQGPRGGASRENDDGYQAFRGGEKEDGGEMGRGEPRGRM